MGKIFLHKKTERKVFQSNKDEKIKKKSCVISIDLVGGVDVLLHEIKSFHYCFSQVKMKFQNESCFAFRFM